MNARLLNFLGLGLSKLALSASLLWLLCGPAAARFRVEVSGVGMTQLPIVVLAFRGEDSSPQKISSIVLAASGAQWPVPWCGPRRRCRR